VEVYFIDLGFMEIPPGFDGVLDGGCFQTGCGSVRLDV